MARILVFGTDPHHLSEVSCRAIRMTPVMPADKDHEVISCTSRDMARYHIEHHRPHLLIVCGPLFPGGAEFLHGLRAHHQREMKEWETHGFKKPAAIPPIILVQEWPEGILSQESQDGIAEAMGVLAFAHTHTFSWMLHNQLMGVLCPGAKRAAKTAATRRR